MKIGIVTLYSINIGNKLQNYAVEQICKKFGHECYTFSISKENICAPALGWKGKLVAYVGFPQNIALLKRNALKNSMKYTVKFNMFSANFLHVINVYSYELLNNLSSEFDAFIVGSDQVWHNYNKNEIDYYFLKFAPEYKRICLSPSFGLNDIPDKFRNSYISGLQGFKYLSAREESGCKIIKALTDRNSELLIDPTLMLDSQEWDMIAGKPNKMDIPSQYILTYFLGKKDEEADQFIKKLSNDTGLPVIEIDNNSYTVPFTAPDEFLYLIRGASYFCTNSFHGCAFSIIYHVNFYVFKRFEYGGMRSRIDTLLKKFDLESRNCFDKNYNEISLKPCDFNNADLVLKAERKKVIDYLQKAFDYSNMFYPKENK